MKKIFIILIVCIAITSLSVASGNAASLFERGERVITTKRYAQSQKGTSNKPVRHGRVLDENSEGYVTIYDPITKRNMLIHRSALRLKK